MGHIQELSNLAPQAQPGQGPTNGPSADLDGQAQAGAIDVNEARIRHAVEQTQVSSSYYAICWPSLVFYFDQDPHYWNTSWLMGLFLLKCQWTIIIIFYILNIDNKLNKARNCASYCVAYDVLKFPRLPKQLINESNIKICFTRSSQTDHKQCNVSNLRQLMNHLMSECADL